MSHPYYNQDVHGPFQTHNIGTLMLEEGGALRDCQLAYATFGKLNKASDSISNPEIRFFIFVFFPEKKFL